MFIDTKIHNIISQLMYSKCVYFNYFFVGCFVGVFVRAHVCLCVYFVLNYVNVSFHYPPKFKVLSIYEISWLKQ